MIASLKAISTKNQTYLSLYQDIFKVLKTVRDSHLSIRLNKVEYFSVVSAELCFPFELYIRNESNVPVVKIRAYQECLDLSEYKEPISKFIEEHKDIPIKSINGTSPFDFIQNFYIYQIYKSRHTHFTLNLDAIPHFSIRGIPYSLSDLIDIEYEFENGDIINLNYVLMTLSNLRGINHKEFEEFYNSLIDNQPNPMLIPNLFQAKKLFLKKKGVLLEETPNKIQWDYQTEDGKLKCREDKVLGYNVFVQTSFQFSSNDDAINVMVSCSKLFYSNNYKIIGIENFNGGGTAVFSEIWHQLIQQKTVDKSYRSLISNKYASEYFKEDNTFSGYSNLETCKYYGSIEEQGEEEDNYGNSEIFGEDIKHNRTKMTDLLDKSWRKKLEAIRKVNFENNNLKNSTDILIFTDGYCFSACSGFLKAFQNTGGAIIVGYSGNPTINGTEEFDGSQSASSVMIFYSDEYYELNKLGYTIGFRII